VGGQGVISASNIIAWAALRDQYKVRTAETHGMAQRGGAVSSYLRFGEKVEGPLIPKGSVDAILSFELSEALRNVSFANKETRFVVSTNVQISPAVLTSRRVVVDLERCIGCGNCIKYCYPNHLKTTMNPPYTYIPDSPISISDGKRADLLLCTGCGQCVVNNVCSFKALSLQSKFYYPTIIEVYENLKRISPYIYFLDAPRLAKEAGDTRTQNTVMIGFLSGLEILPIDVKILYDTTMEQIPPKAKEANMKAYDLGKNAAKAFNERDFLASIAKSSKSKQLKKEEMA
jgi:Pyruvate/2-oxoacid:ferredoxin oxidoreductase gamma subunit